METKKKKSRRVVCRESMTALLEHYPASWVLDDLSRLCAKRVMMRVFSSRLAEAAAEAKKIEQEKLFAKEQEEQQQLV